MVVFVPLEVLIHVFFALIAGKLFGGIFQKSIKVFPLAIGPFLLVVSMPLRRKKTVVVGFVRGLRFNEDGQDEVGIDEHDKYSDGEHDGTELAGKAY